MDIAKYFVVRAEKIHEQVCPKCGQLLDWDKYVPSGMYRTKCCGLLFTAEPKLLLVKEEQY